MASPIVFEGPFHEQIVQAGASLRALLYTPYPGAVQTFYIFLLHLSCLSDDSVKPDHDHPCKAPFAISAQGVVISSAHYVRKGIIHHGYQIVIAQRLSTEIRISLKTKPLWEHSTQPIVFEPVRFHLFGDSSLNPLTCLDVVILYRYPNPFIAKKQFITVLGDHLDKGFKIVHPIPYYHSPIPNLQYLDNSYKNYQVNFPLCSTIADTEIAYTSKFVPWGANFTSWTRLSEHKPEKLPNFSNAVLREMQKGTFFDTPYLSKLRHIFFRLLPKPLPNPTIQEKGTQTDGLLVMMLQPNMMENPGTSKASQRPNPLTNQVKR